MPGRGRTAGMCEWLGWQQHGPARPFGTVRARRIGLAGERRNLKGETSVEARTRRSAEEPPGRTLEARPRLASRPVPRRRPETPSGVYLPLRMGGTYNPNGSNCQAEITTQPDPPSPPRMRGSRCLDLSVRTHARSGGLKKEAASRNARTLRVWARDIPFSGGTARRSRLRKKTPAGSLPRVSCCQAAPTVSGCGRVRRLPAGRAVGREGGGRCGLQSWQPGSPAPGRPWWRDPGRLPAAG